MQTKEPTAIGVRSVPLCIPRGLRSATLHAVTGSLALLLPAECPNPARPRPHIGPRGPDSCGYLAASVGSGQRLWSCSGEWRCLGTALGPIPDSTDPGKRQQLGPALSFHSFSCSLDAFWYKSVAHNGEAGSSGRKISLYQMLDRIASDSCTTTGLISIL